MKNIGILFDVSKSMKEKFDNINNLNSINKKSGELINILKNIAKNIEANIFTILFGLSKSPYIIDFIKLLEITNSHFKPLETKRSSLKKFFLNEIYKAFEKDEGLINNFIKNQIIKKTSFADYRKKFFSLITNNSTRFCKIEDYIFQSSEENDYELLAEFYCHLIEEDSSISDQIYNSLPIEIRSEEAFIKMKKKGDFVTDLLDISSIGVGIAGVCIGASSLTLTPIVAGAFLGGLISHEGEKLKQQKAEELVKEYTKATIIKIFKLCIEKKLDKILNEYPYSNNYKLIKAEELLKLIEALEDKILTPKGESLNIMELFDKYIYGNIPLYYCYNNVFNIFKNRRNDRNIVIIISDGKLNDFNLEKTKKDIIYNSNKLNIITICIYLNSNNNNNKSIKKFYNKTEDYFDEGAKFLFSISSKLNYHDCVIKYFMKKGWEIPLNGVCNLFIEVNNSQNLNEIITLINESLDNKDPLEELNNIIGDILLKKIIDVNYIGQFKAEDQCETGWCWAFSISTVIYLTSSRIFGRKLDKFKNILYKLLKLENSKRTDKYEDQGRSLYYTLKKHIKKFNLRFSVINSKEARIAVMNGRPCVSSFNLYEWQWINFRKFFEKHKKGILTKDELNKSKPYSKGKPEGHAVVLIAIEENCLVFLNSWGTDFADNGYFRVKDENVLNISEFIDIFWNEDDLTMEEKDFYKKYHLNFIKQTTKFLSQPNISVEKLKYKVEKCYECAKSSFFKDYKIILYQKHYDNDDEDIRELEVICPKCKRQIKQSKFSEELITFLYIDYIIN